MTTWIALLRGINVGGKGMLPMKELVALLEDLACEDVKTYVQSGNAVFRSGEPAAKLAAKIEKRLHAAYKFQPRLLLLSRKELEQAAKANPYAQAEKEPATLHLMFLAEAPKKADLAQMKAIKSESEAFALAGKVFYLHLPDGAGRSKLAARAEKLLGVDATARNWRTVTKLMEMAHRCEEKS